MHRAAAERVDVGNRQPSAESTISEGKSGSSREGCKDEFGFIHVGLVTARRLEPVALNLVLCELKRGEGPGVDFGVDGVYKIIESGGVGD